MLSVFPAAPEASGATPLHAGALWIDMFAPSEETRRQVQAATGLSVPTQAELSEIESSSRLWREGNVLTLSLPALVRGEGGEARTSPIGFVLAPDRLLTIRFAPQPGFDTYAARCRLGQAGDHTSLAVLLGLCEALVERIADELEREGEELETVSRRVFRPAGPQGRRPRPRRAEAQLRALLRTVGHVGDVVSHLRDMLLVLGRMLPFVLGNAAWITADQRPRFKTLRADIISLNDYDSHLANKVQFLLEATMGFIGIEQNNIIRVLTVVSVAGVPPTFLASLWGMNFQHMPELSWPWGYPLSLLAILLSGVVPLLWFRLRGWL